MAVLNNTLRLLLFLLGAYQPVCFVAYEEPLSLTPLHYELRHVVCYIWPHLNYIKMKAWWNSVFNEKLLSLIPLNMTLFIFLADWVILTVRQKYNCQESTINLKTITLLLASSLFPGLEINLIQMYMLSYCSLLKIKLQKGVFSKPFWAPQRNKRKHKTKHNITLFS